MYTLVKFIKSDLLVYLPGGPINYFIAERTDTKCGPGVHFNSGHITLSRNKCVLISMLGGGGTSISRCSERVFDLDMSDHEMINSQ